MSSLDTYLYRRAGRSGECRTGLLTFLAWQRSHAGTPPCAIQFSSGILQLTSANQINAAKRGALGLELLLRKPVILQKVRFDGSLGRLRTGNFRAPTRRRIVHILTQHFWSPLIALF